MRGRDGTLRDVCLGFDSGEDYIKQNAYIGAVIGRCANRIAGARFALDGRVCQLSANEGVNHLHGGENGFDKRCFEYDLRGSGVTFFRVSPDGEEGYPGRLNFSVTYRFVNNTLSVEYNADCDCDTVLNPTLHAYFNLSGENDILEHTLKINAGAYTEAGADLIPTGRLVRVYGTPFDFTRKCRLGSRIGAAALAPWGGYDHNFALRGKGLKPAAVLSGGGLSMTLRTDMPGLQVYTGNYLSGTAGKGGKRYGRYAGVALEPQFYPDTPNHGAFPSCVLKAGEHFRSESVYTFTAEE